MLWTNSARQDAQLLKAAVLNQPMPKVEVLNGGLEILRTADLRQPVAGLALPLLRVYSYLYGLVPRKVAERLDISWPHSASVMMPKAAHAPFISHTDEFASIIVAYLAQHIKSLSP